MHDNYDEHETRQQAIADRVSNTWMIISLCLSFAVGYAWATYNGYKDMSQFGTQLQCTQSGDVQK